MKTNTKLKDVLTAPFVQEVADICANMYRMGWDERNGGNVSMLIDTAEAAEYLDLDKPVRRIDVRFDASELAGRVLIVTGTGKYFKNVLRAPQINTGILRICDNGTEADVLWGLEDGGRPTSELPAHLRSHIVRLAADPLHRVIMHTHPNNTIAMTFVHELSEREFTRTLWRMMTECLVVFPDGVGILPWMLCGNDEIGCATAEKLKEFRLCIWAHHGIFGTGRDIDEAFGLIETVEKAAEIFFKIGGRKILSNITDEQLKILGDAFKVNYRKDYLD